MTPTVVLSVRGMSVLGVAAMPISHPLTWADCPAVERNPQRVSGAWVFRGTRIPVVALFQNLEDGVSLAEFVEFFPGVTIEQAQDVLGHAARSTAMDQS